MKSEVGPSYPFFASDFNGSSRVQRMSMEEDYCYRRLLDVQFQEGKVPADIAQMARLCKNCGVPKMKRLWAAISDCFELLPDGSGYVNKKQAAIRQDIIEFRRNRSDNGRKGNEVKRAQRDAERDAKNNAERDAERIAKRTPPLPIPISPSQGKREIQPSRPNTSKPDQGGRADLRESVGNHWKAVQRFIQSETNADHYARLFEPIQVSNAEGDFLILRVPQALVDNYGGDIGEAQTDLEKLIKQSGHVFLRGRKLALEVL